MHLPMYTRMWVYLVTCVIVIMMLMILYEVMLKTLKKQCICPCVRVLPSGDTQHLLSLGPLLRPKITQDGRKMAARWSQDGPRWPKMAQDGPEVA